MILFSAQNDVSTDALALGIVKIKLTKGMGVRKISSDSAHCQRCYGHPNMGVVTMTQHAIR